MLKAHRALEPGLLESTYWLPRERRPPWDQRRREAHGQSVMNGFVVLLRALGVSAENHLSSIAHGVIVNFARSHRGPQKKFEPSSGNVADMG